MPKTTKNQVTKLRWKQHKWLEIFDQKYWSNLVRKFKIEYLIAHTFAYYGYWYKSCLYLIFSEKREWFSEVKNWQKFEQRRSQFFWHAALDAWLLFLMVLNSKTTWVWISWWNYNIPDVNCHWIWKLKSMEKSISDHGGPGICASHFHEFGHHLGTQDTPVIVW